MFGFGRKTQKEHAQHSQMEHAGHAQAEMGGHSMDASDSGPKTVLRIEGMTCMHCKMSVEKALKDVEGENLMVRRAMRMHVCVPEIAGL